MRLSPVGQSHPLLRVDGLSVELPGGEAILSNTSLTVSPGQVFSLLGPSGAGKSTLLRAVFSSDELRRKGYRVTWIHRDVSSEPAFVPQRGALLDHLDVAGNIAIGQTDGAMSVEQWLRAVDLDESFAAPGRSTSALSGGQAQRVAVARTLAAGRKLIVLDEPSVGLDPLGVRLLARLLITQARRHQAGIVVITHDLALAGGASDAILFLDPAKRRVVPVLHGWAGPLEMASPDTRRARLAGLEEAIEDLLLGERAPVRGTRISRRRAFGLLAPVRIAGLALVGFFDPRLMRKSTVVLRQALSQSLLRPLSFYATVGVLLGLTVPYVIVHISSAVKPSAMLGLIGGSYILSLAPPLSAIVFAATSGSAVNAWLGGLGLNGQAVALEGLGIPPARYLWSPAWVALVWSYLVTFLAFVGSMIAGGWMLFGYYGVPHALAKLTADFLDPIPSRIPYLMRAIWLVVMYAGAIASIVVAKGSEPKEKSDEVTTAMTSSVMRSTLLVVVLELVSIFLLFALTGDSR